MTGFWEWLADTALRTAALFALIDLCLIGERLFHRWQQHRGTCERCQERAARRAHKRRHRRQALEATPQAGRGLPMLRAWLTAPTGASANPASVGAPQSPVDAVSTRLAASTGLHLARHRHG